MNGMGMGGGDRWWSIEELGEGASVVRSKTGVHGNGVDREVWVLRVGSDDHGGSESTRSSFSFKSLYTIQSGTGHH
jgi:hypothetical protein